MNVSIRLFLLALLMSGMQAFAQKQLPPFSFQDLDGNRFTREQLTENRATLVLFFDPYCDHCAKQAEWIAADADAFKEIQLLWVTTEEAAPTKEFEQKYFAKVALPYLHVLRDPDFLFDGFFGYSEVPSIYLYNAKGQRVKSFNKETPTNILLKFL